MFIKGEGVTVGTARTDTSAFKALEQRMGEKSRSGGGSSTDRQGGRGLPGEAHPTGG